MKLTHFCLHLAWSLVALIRLHAQPLEHNGVTVPRADYTARDGEIQKLRDRLISANQQTFQPYTFLDPSGLSLPYRLFQPAEPKPGQRYPLLLVLHGAGSRGTDNLAHITGKHASITTGYWTLPEHQATHPCFVLAPQCPPEPQAWIKNPDWVEGRHPFHETPAPALLATVHLLDRLLEEYPIDPARVYVLGASMGGYGTWDLLTRYPQKFAAAVPVCSGLADGQAPKIAHLPVWVFHGTLDDVEPISGSRSAVAQLQRAGGHPRYTEYQGGDHGISLHAWTEPGLLEWLFSQKLSP